MLIRVGLDSVMHFNIWKIHVPHFIAISDLLKIHDVEGILMSKFDDLSGFLRDFIFNVVWNVTQLFLRI
jgi:hypothetical protein